MISCILSTCRVGYYVDKQVENASTAFIKNENVSFLYGFTGAINTKDFSPIRGGSRSVLVVL